MKALEVIAHGLHKNVISEMFKGIWGSGCKARASSILNAICTYKHFVIFLCICKMLSHLSDIKIKMRGSTVSILQALNETESAKENVQTTKM